MDAIRLEPLSIQVEFVSALSRSSTEWSGILGRLLQRIASGCETTKHDVVIGHIKGLAPLPGDGYIRSSVIGGALPADSEASTSVELSSITASINVMVYGLDISSLETIARAEARAFSSQSDFEVTVRTVFSKDHHAHE